MAQQTANHPNESSHMSDNAPLIDIRHLSVAVHQGERATTLVKDLSLQIMPGETLALVGESGSGKSVSALSILGLHPDTIRYPHGEIVYRGENLLTAPANHLRGLRGNRISMIFQEPMVSLNPLHTVVRQLSESLIIHQAMSSAAARQRVLEWLEKVGLRNPHTKLDVFPHQLSGGERQRVMIAMALLNAPDLLIADEPTTALDVSVQAQILTLLQQLQREMNMAMLFITHDLGIVRRLADRVAVMRQGELVETAPTQQLFNQPQHPYTQKLLDSEPKGEPVPAPTPAQTLLNVEALRVWFPIKRGLLKRTVGHVKAVDDVSFSVNRGESLGLVGESGSGKSTCGLALLRLLPSQGEIRFDDADLNRLNRKQMLPYRSRIQVIFQDPFSSLSPRMPVGDIIAEGLRLHACLSAQESEQQVISIMQEVGLDPESRHRYAFEFSGGQRQRIAIARALILRPELLILDEPTSSLDRTVQAQILALLKQLQARHGLAYLFISHDLHVVRALCHQVMVLKDGKIVEAGPTESLFRQPQHPYTQMLLSAARY